MIEKALGMSMTRRSPEDAMHKVEDYIEKKMCD